MILSLMVLAIVLSLSVGAGYLVTRPLRLGDAPATDRLFFSAAAGLGVISSLMAIIGALDAYNPIGFGFGAIFLIVGGGLGRSACIADLRVIGDGLRTAISASTTSKVLFGLILFHWGVLLFAAFSPVYGYDALDRHLSIAKEYVHAGGFIPLTHIWGGDFPNQGVMLYTLALVLGDDRLAQITNVFALTCGMLGVFVLARPLKSVPLRLGASLVVLSLPAVTQYVASPYIDVYVQVWILAAWLALGNYANRSHSNDLIAGGLFGGLAAAVKYQGCIALASLLAFATVWLHVRGEPWYRSITRVVVCGVIAGIPVGFWLAKAAWFTGNPVYPFLHTVFGGINWSEAAAAAQREYVGWYVIPFTPAGLAHSIWAYLFDTSIYMSNVFGPLFLFGLFVAVSADLRKRLGWIALFGLFSLLVFFHFTTQIRFIYHAMPFLAIAAAGGVGHALERFRQQRRPLLATIGLLYSIHLIYAAALVGYVAEGVVGLVSRDSYLTKRVQYYDSYLFINENLPADAGVLIPRSFGYYLDRRYLPWKQKDQGVINHHEMTTPSVLHRKLDSLGLSYVVEYSLRPSKGVLRDLLMAEGDLIYEGPKSSVYALGSPSLHGEQP